MDKPLIVVMVDTRMAQRVIKEETWRALESWAEVRRNPLDHPLDTEDARKLVAGARGILTGWGTRNLVQEVLCDAPDLEIVSHSAGSLCPIISDALWDRNIKVTSASDAIAVDVALTTIGLMLVSIKNIWRLVTYTRAGGWYGGERERSHEMNGKTIGIIGASNVGRRVMAHLRDMPGIGGDVKVLLYDPYCSEARAKELGAEKADLETLMAESDIISVHAPATDETRHMLNARNLAMMKENAIIINTARGALIDETALVDELARRPTLTACIDVTEPEPPSLDSPLRRLDNVILMPHVAGCVNNCTRLGALAAEELRRHFAGEPPLFQITRDMMSRTG